MILARPFHSGGVVAGGETFGSAGAGSGIISV